MISRHANQFAGMQCDGDVEVFWHENGPEPLHGWYWRPLGTSAARGPWSTSRGALLDAINRGHVHASGAGTC